MERIKIALRDNFVKKLEDLSFEFHSLQNIYWDESAYYQFSMEQILNIEKATNDLWEMMLAAVQHVIDNELYDQLFINPNMRDLIKESWEEEHVSVYGRFDFAYDGKGVLKLLEFNADTPTSLYEAAVVQWYWLQDVAKENDQFNSIHERLLDYWQGCRKYFNGNIVYFSCIKDSIEDFTTVEYLRDIAHQAGLNTKFIYVNEIGWNGNDFTDNEENVIKYIFKLYPWEWLSNEEFGENVTKAQTQWIEPVWKAILSNKGILPILYQLYPDCPYILPCYFDSANGMVNYIKKPIYSREGANTTIFKNSEIIEETSGEYGEEGFIYQQLVDLPNYEGNYPIIGSWLIDGKAAGMGIRESNKLITDNFSRFIPHLIK